MKPFLLYIALLFSTGVNAQIITTFAGGGTGGLGDGGPATAAQVPNPIGGIFDKYGNYYCAEASTEIIRKVSYVGIVTTIAGTNGSSGFSGDNGSATAAELSSPTAVRLDTDGNFYINDANNNRIRKVDATTGIIVTIAGGSTGGYGGDNGPATSALLWDPQDICFDKFGNLYIADGTNQRVRKINTLGIITTVAGIGIPGSTGDYGQATTAKIQFPVGLAVDDTGNIYIAGLDHLVRKVNSAGIITTVAGISGTYAFTGDGIPATNAHIAPIKLAIDPLGQLVIADNLNRRVFRVDNAGIIHTIAGNGMTGFSGDGVPATSTSLDYPSGVAFDSCGNLLITEANNNRVRKVTFDTSCHFLGSALSTNKIVENSGISMYPNPTNDILNIDNLKTQSTYYLQSIIGATLQQGTLKVGNNTISIRSLPPGTYIVELIDDEGNKTVKKIIKQ